jgi:glycerophosphoryl diester phosphodiesterase
MSELPDEFRQIPIAHRALHDADDGRPENSLAAMRAAIAAGYGIEMDLQISGDGRAMVFHDYHLERLTDEQGLVVDRDAADLGRIRLKHGDEGIPTFAEVLELVAGRVPILVELKDQHGQLGKTDSRLERAVADDLKAYVGPVAVMSFNPNSIITLAELAPDVPRGIVTSTYAKTNKNWQLLRSETRDRLRDIPDYDRAQAAFISHQIDDLANPRVAELKAKGAVILCWTVRSVKQERKARKLADNITFEGYRAEIRS